MPVILGCKPDAETVMLLGTITERRLREAEVVKAEGNHRVYPVVNGRVVSTVVQGGRYRGSRSGATAYR
ncbi:MAG: hypothetical protein IPH60_00025 [Flavobacteriales bacterium]|nr:hypothetical protein [Flavobacteriales bacterium]